tara:strand:+ start:191 stop:472 length:282 start_codon:yes stop_codon:yes gene_type:complete
MVVFTAKVFNFIGDDIYITETYPKISEAQAEAQRYIRKHKVDRDWKFGDGPFKGCVVEIFKGKKKYATYRWVPYHARYETHLVMRGGRFRKTT